MKEYRKITLRDRCLIKIGIDNRQSPGLIAKKMERNRSVIAREIEKNGGLLWYDPAKAHEKSLKSNKAGYSKINRNKKMREYIILKIMLGWSPVIIAGKWNLENRLNKITH